MTTESFFLIFPAEVRVIAGPTILGKVCSSPLVPWLSASQVTEYQLPIARLALNYKGLPYETRWTEYPEIEPLFKSFGIEPHPTGRASAPYAIPAARMPDGKYVMDSLEIAKALEVVQPSPSLHLTSPRVVRAQAAVQQTLDALGAIVKPRVPQMVLNPTSADYFSNTRSKKYGMSLEEVAKSDLAGESAWISAAEGMTLFRDLLVEDQTGPYVMGNEPGFADFVMAGFWRFLQIFDRDGDLFGRLMKFDESFPAHFAACEKWLVKDD